MQREEKATVAKEALTRGVTREQNSHCSRLCFEFLRMMKRQMQKAIAPLLQLGQSSPGFPQSPSYNCPAFPQIKQERGREIKERSNRRELMTLLESCLPPQQLSLLFNPPHALIYGGRGSLRILEGSNYLCLASL